MRPHILAGLKSVILLGAASLALPISAQNGGVAAAIHHQPLFHAIPTLNGTALIALGLMLACVAFQLLKGRKSAGTHLVVAITVAAALATGGGGFKLIADAHGIVFLNSLFMTISNGGVLNIPFQAGSSRSCVYNSTDKAQKITKIEYVSPCGTLNGASLGSAADFTIANGAGTCGVNGASYGGDFVGWCEVNTTTLAPGKAQYCIIGTHCTN
jgi:hypothetical protein